MTQRPQSDSASSGKQKLTRKRGAPKGSHRRRRLLVEGLESRQLLNADTGGGGLNNGGNTIDPNLFVRQEPRNIGAVTAFTYNEQEGLNVSGLNDAPTRSQAEFVPLGTRPQDQDTIDLFGSMEVTFSSNGNFSVDVDSYRVFLQAGDILDLSVLGATTNLTVTYGEISEDPADEALRATRSPRLNQIWFGSDANNGVGAYPDGSPLQTLGIATAAQVVPETRNYYITVSPSSTALNYTMGLRAYRPVLEGAPIGSGQIIYLDFDGGIYPASLFQAPNLPILGTVRISGLNDSLDVLGFTNPNAGDADSVIDATVNEVILEMRTLAEDGSLGSGTNGDFITSGVPGDYGVTVLNSRDHADPGFNNPLVTRVIIGSEVGNGFDPGTLFGIATSIDVGNFRPDELVLASLEAHAASIAGFVLSPSVSFAQAVSQQLAATITHELGHSFGIWHTDGANFTDNLMDEGSASLVDFSQGLGPDNIYGTADDITPYFNDDRFSVTEAVYFGTERVPAALSQVLSTGTVGSVLSGRVFSDANRDGSGTNDTGLGGVTVFADLDGDRILDDGERFAVTDASGNYSISLAPGTYTVVAITPIQFVPTTGGGSASSNPTENASAGASNVNFGFNQVVADITGTVFADNNGNGLPDANEGRVAGVFVYADLDGDDRPDLGEPSATTDSNGQYSLSFPGPGTYTIRTVIDAGFQITEPSNNERTVNFNGLAVTDNADFFFLPSRDYGDAPDSYLTSVNVGGPSHGISLGLGLGPAVDRETNGRPTADASGDDTNNIDDEDGVSLVSPLGPGGTATFEIITRNTSGSDAFLQAWLDFNANGTFEASEQIATNLVLPAGTNTLEVNVPSTAAVGTTFARFRYSPTAGLGVGGDADVGEVEDHQFDILQAAAVANNDEFTVSRNSPTNQLDVLANDFETSVTQLTIVGLDLNSTEGVVSIASNGRSIFYTPRTGFTGRDIFQYIVRDQSGTQFTAAVVVNVNFQSTVPFAVDDTFDIPQGSANRALNVLDNDVFSIFGGLTIVSVTAGDQGGLVQLEGGGQTVRYTAPPGFTGTEQFFYSVRDGANNISTAQVTVNSQPGARLDDLVDFKIELFDVTNNLPITNVQVGQAFNVRVSVNELNNPNFSDSGVASAFLDLLYTDELVATQDTITGDNFNFDIVFGENFQGGGFKLGSASIPGLIDDVGAVQPITGGSLIQHTDFAELFTITMTAVSPGVAVFAGDPADIPQAETILVGEDVALTPAQQRLGRTELTIFPASDNFASAIDDAFNSGTDSLGNVINSLNGPNTLDVLANDNFGPTGGIREFGLATQPSRGTAQINTNGTTDPSDDTVNYFANVNARGFDRFEYLIVSNDGVRSTAEVTMTLGGGAGDELVSISLELINQAGQPITTIESGQTFGVQVFVEDLRTNLEGNTAVFAAYQDVLYNSGLVTPGAGIGGGRYDFDVAFDSDFDATAGVGTAVRPGIIDEFGSLLIQSGTTVTNPSSIIEPNLMATLYFVAGDVSTPTQTSIIGSPADASPFQDTLLLNVNDPVPVSQIRYDELIFTITPDSGQTNPAMPEDVNDDGQVTPSDVLTVINRLALEGEGENGSSRYYTDVNGDLRTTVLDALRVINYLAVSQASGEGEFVGSDRLALASTDSGSSMLDDALSSFDSSSKLIGGSSPDSSGSPSSNGLGDYSGSTAGGEDDNDDDLLSLLADDQNWLV